MGRSLRVGKQCMTTTFYILHILMGMILLDLVELLLLSHGATQISAEPERAHSTDNNYYIRYPALASTEILGFGLGSVISRTKRDHSRHADTGCSSTQLLTVACKGETYTITGLVSP